MYIFKRERRPRENHCTARGFGSVLALGVWWRWALVETVIQGVSWAQKCWIITPRAFWFLWSSLNSFHSARTPLWHGLPCTLRLAFDGAPRDLSAACFPWGLTCSGCLSWLPERVGVAMGQVPMDSHVSSIADKAVQKWLILQMALLGHLETELPSISFTFSWNFF